MKMSTNQLNLIGNKQEVCTLINKIFQKHGLSETIVPINIEFTDQCLWNGYKLSEDETNFVVDRKMPDMIYNHLFPIPTEQAFYHYTTLSGFRSILKEVLLKLNNLQKNYGDDEFRSFYHHHDLSGYEILDESGLPYEDALMKDLFCMSFAKKNGLSVKSDIALWRSFADNGGGVRVEFNIKTKHPDFRCLYYSEIGNSKTILTEISEVIFKEFNRKFAIRSISKMGAFFLPGDYKIENEVRLIIKKGSDEYEFNTDYKSESNSFMKLPFNSEYGYFRIVAVTPGIKCNKQVFDELILDSKGNFDFLIN